MSAAEGQGGVLSALSDELAGVIERVSRSVVTVDARRRLPASGIVWSNDGVVVTADHVVERDEDINVYLPDGQKVSATLAGRDPGSDVAVLRLAGAKPTPAPVAPDGTLKVGHFVLALGLPGSGSATASFGIVSALGGSWRTARGGVIESYIHADLTLYPGFSGGPLADLQGRIVGMNSSHFAGGRSIAIPSAPLGRIIETLLSRGHVRRAYLGVGTQPVPLPPALRQHLGLTQDTGLMILNVEPGTPAEQGGLMLGDILVVLDGQPIAVGEDLQAALGPNAVGKQVTLSVIRGGQRKDLTVTPVERPVTTSGPQAFRARMHHRHG